MAGEEAVIRILLDESAPQQASVTPPAPTPTSNKPSQQAEYLRLEAEAARRGISVSEYKKHETGAAQGANTSPPAAGPPAGLPTDEEIRKEVEERQQRLTKKRAEIGYDPYSLSEPGEKPPSSVVPVLPLDEEVRREAEERRERIAKKRAAMGYDPYALSEPGEAPPASVPVSTTSAPALPTPVSTAAIDPLKALEKQIEMYESWMPAPGSPAAVKLEKLKAQLARGGAPEAGGFDPVAIAKKRVEREEQRAAVEAEYQKLKPPAAPEPPPPFDPVVLARKRVEAEQRRAAVEAEYRKLNPITARARSGLDALLDSIESFRGTIFAIGGTLGRAVSTVMLVASRVRAIRAEASARAQDASAPAFAQPAGPVAQVAPPAPSAIPVAQPVPNAPVAQPVPHAIPAPNQPGTTATAVAAGAGSSIAAGVASAAPYVAIAFIVVGAIKGLVDTLNKTADKYGEYNPLIAQAQAQAEIKAIMNDIRRANESGPELAKFVKAQAELQQHWEEIKIKVLMGVTPVLTKILEGISFLVGAANRDEFKDIKDPVEIILDPARVREVQQGATIPLVPGIDILQ